MFSTIQSGAFWDVRAPYKARIYSHPDASFPSRNDTIDVSIELNFNQAQQNGLAGAYSFEPSISVYFTHTFPDGSWGGTRSCDYDAEGTFVGGNSYCPAQLQIQQTTCPESTVIVEGDFQADYPISPAPISSTQTFQVQ